MFLLWFPSTVPQFSRTWIFLSFFIVSCSFSSHYFLSHFHGLLPSFSNCNLLLLRSPLSLNFLSVNSYIIYHSLTSSFMSHVWLYFKHIFFPVSLSHLLPLPQLLNLLINIFLSISHTITFHHSLCPHLLFLLSSHRIFLHSFILIQSSSIVNTLKSWKISVRNYLCVDEWTFCVMSSV